jgi:hypothetical protein
MPGTDQVERGIGCTEASNIEHPNKTPVGDQSVRGDKVAVVHDVGGIAAREIAHLGPDGSKSCDVKQAFAVGQALLHPFVVGAQFAAATVTVVGSPASIDGSDGVDEIAQICGERIGFAAIVSGSGLTRKPGVDRPR